MTPRPETAHPFIAWVSICFLLAMLGVPNTRTLCVCEGCTLVFRPRRKASARWCHLCAKHHPPSWKGACVAPEKGLVDLRKLGVIGLSPLEKPGDRVRVRAPVRESPTSRVVTGWGMVTVGRCEECGDLFHGRQDAVLCRSPSCRGRRARKAAGRSVA